jgi:UDP-hydrolysing UDP-N-acetyl-D-glucosamine 2-epimerase
MRSLCFFTGTRAEYGLLRRVMRHVAEDGRARLGIIVGGAHLSERYGRTIDEIEADGFTIDTAIDALSDGDDDNSILNALGQGVIRYGEALKRINPDLAVVLGDRYETFAFAAAATVLRIPLAHIGGGEATFGSNDEAYRHAITKMAHFHFASCETYARRIMQLGESPGRIWNTGALGVDNIHNLEICEESDIRRTLAIDPQQPYILATIHPETLLVGRETVLCGEFLKATEAFPHHIFVFTGANADTGGGVINAAVSSYVERLPARFRFFLSLGVVGYLSAARYAACVAGNSSSGVIEIPSLHIPVVDIGDRQEGRIRSRAVLHSGTSAGEIISTLKTALHPRCVAVAKAADNPYDKPGTARKIAGILCDPALELHIKKNFSDLPSGVSPHY